MSQYTDRQTKATVQKAELEIVLVDTGKKLVEIEQARADATAEKKSLEAENQIIKKDMEDVEMAIQNSVQ